MIKFRKWERAQSHFLCDITDRDDWFILTVAHTRDSGFMEESNWRVALDRLGGESDTVEVVRFSHWGPGWVERILVDSKDEDRVEEAR